MSTEFFSALQKCLKLAPCYDEVKKKLQCVSQMLVKHFLLLKVLNLHVQQIRQLCNCWSFDRTRLAVFSAFSAVSEARLNTS